MCHNQCWWRFSASNGIRGLSQRIAALPTYTDLKLSYTLASGDIPYNSTIIITVLQDGVEIEHQVYSIKHQAGKHSTIMRVAKTGDQAEVRIESPGGLTWKIRGVKLKY